MSNNDFDSDEREFQREIKEALRTGGTLRICPRPDLVMAVQSGVVFEGSEDVRRHVEQCPVCEQLSRDLSEYNFPPVSDAEDRRIRARWEEAGIRPEKFWRRWQFLSAAGAVAALAIVILLVRGTHKPPGQEQARKEIATPSPAPVSSVFSLAKAPIKIPASAALTYRSDANSGKKYLTDLAAALDPYQRDDFQEASRRLAALALKYPNAAEPRYYNGVALLFLNRNEAAIESLQSARGIHNEAIADDISWYLAAAFEREGRKSDALREADNLCSRAGEYHDKACAAANVMRSR